MPQIFGVDREERDDDREAEDIDQYDEKNG